MPGNRDDRSTPQGGSIIATIRFIGAAKTSPQVTTITISSNTNGHTFTVTLNTKVVTYTAASDTTTTIATALQALLDARDEPDFTEITFTTSTNTIICTGPDDGTPFTLSLGGTGTSSQATTSGTPSSPNDLALAANYSGGAVPSAADVLVLEESDVSIKWGLTTLATTGITLVRRATYTGSIGLPEINPAGYPEYRTTHMQVKAAVTTWESSQQDSAGQFRLEYLTTAAAITVAGDAGGVRVGDEALEIKGMPASSSLKVAGGSVAVCPLKTQTGTLATITTTDATVRVGSGTTVSGAVTLNATVADVRATVGGLLTVDGDASDVVVADAAAATGGVTAKAGRVAWRSSGSPGVVAVSGTGELTANDSPVTCVPTSVTVGKGGTVRDRYGKMTGYTLTVTCPVDQVTLELGGAAIVVP